MMDKAALRRTKKSERSALPMSFCLAGSAIISETLLQLPEYKKSQTIMAYLAMPKEVNLDAFILVALREGKTVFVPVCTDQPGIMEAARMTSFTMLTEGALNIRTPQSGYEKASPGAMDLVLVPGVAFDYCGGRLGMGAGYYDRFLPSVDREKRIGVAWQSQLTTTSLPMDSNDCFMGAVITEKNHVYF